MKYKLTDKYYTVGELIFAEEHPYTKTPAMTKISSNQNQQLYRKILLSDELKQYINADRIDVLDRDSNIIVRKTGDDIFILQKSSDFRYRWKHIDHVYNLRHDPPVIFGSIIQSMNFDNSEFLLFDDKTKFVSWLNSQILNKLTSHRNEI